MKISGLYVITDELVRPGRTHEAIAAAAVAGGASLVQLRDKHSSDRRFYEAALAIRAITRRVGVPLIINNRADIALAVDADGVHVGGEDLPVLEVKRIIGRRKVVGVSAATPNEILEAVSAEADYLGVGPIFNTSTKSDAGEPVGLERLLQLKRASLLPIVAIGGIDGTNIKDVAATGVASAAVISAIVKADDMERAVRELVEAFNNGRA